MNVLIVEDEDSLAEVIRRGLEELVGVSCLLAPSTEEAEALLASRSVDAVTLDLRMPGRNGLEWLEAMAAREPELARKTLVITGQHLEPDAIERLARCGAGLLAKPFTLAGLHEAARTQLAHQECCSRLDN